jgi:hypothetical protein
MMKKELERAEKMIAHLYNALWQVETIVKDPEPNLSEKVRLEKIMEVIRETAWGAVILRGIAPPRKGETAQR